MPENRQPPPQHGGGAGGCCWASGAGEHRPGPEKGQFRQKAVCGFWRTDPPPGLGDWRAERGRARPPPPQTGRKVHEKFLGTEISRRGGVKAERPAGSEREGALRGRGTREQEGGGPSAALGLRSVARPLTVHVVSSQPMMAHRGRTSELSTSLEGWTTPQM